MDTKCETNLSDWLPQPGEVNMGDARRGENKALLVLEHPSSMPGYVRIYCVEFGGDIDAGGTLEGIRRGVRLDQISNVIAQWGIFEVDWWGRTPETTDLASHCKGLYDSLEPRWMREMKDRWAEESRKVGAQS